jgi:thiamine-phosphate pyrophosphorylase
MSQPPSPADRAAAYRILDANFNRAAEGLRTLEEVVRFAWSDAASLSGPLKQIRHRLNQLCQQLDRQQLLANRDAIGDPGRQQHTPQELSRTGILSIAQAAVGRIQQAMRCLEEFSKVVAPSAVVEQLKGLRFDSYQLLSSIERRLLSIKQRSWLADAKLYALVDAQLPIEPFCQRLVELAEAGVDLFQLRDKSLEDHQLLAYAEAAVEALRPTRSRLIINDAVDVALLSGAAGVHLGQTDLPASRVRQIVGDRLVIGVSTHDLDQLHQAISDGADYIGCGPTFPSSTKQFSEFPGIEFLRAAAAQTRLPLFAIGGIDLQRLPEVLTAGVRRVAVGGALWRAPQPAGAARQMAGLLADDSAVCVE